MGESWKISLNSPPTIWELVEANLQRSFSCFFSLISQTLLKHSQLLCNKLYSFFFLCVCAKSITLSLTPDFLQPCSQFMLHAWEHVVVPVSANELSSPLCHFLVISLQVSLYSEPFSLLPPPLHMSATFTMCKALLIDKSLSNTAGKIFYAGFQNLTTFPCKHQSFRPFALLFGLIV